MTGSVIRNEVKNIEKDTRKKIEKLNFVVSKIVNINILSIISNIFYDGLH